VWLFALTLYVLLYPRRWDYSPFVMRSQYLNVLLPVLLVPAAAWLLIARLIHAESLVGDRQWWLTRPYRWQKLLAAKSLFLACWVYVPFVVAEAAILKEGGLSPLGHFAGWLYLLAIASAYGVLPLVTIATVTANFARMTLTLLGAVALWVGATSLTSMPGSGYESNVPYDHSFWIVFVAVFGAGGALVLQFAMRRVWFARAVVAATVALAIGLGMLFTAMRQHEIDRAYPAADASAVAPVQLAFGQRWDLKTISSERPEKIYVTVPVVFSGVADGAAVEVNNVRVTLDDPVSGQRWTSPWWASRTLRFLPGQHQAGVMIMLDRNQYERFKSSPVTLHLALALSKLRATDDRTATITDGDFPVTGFGVCSGRWLYQYSSELMCRSSVLELPPQTLASTVWTRSPDSDAYVPPGPITAANWANIPSDNGPIFRLLPVWADRVNLYPISRYGPLSSTRGLELASGTPVHFTQYAVTGRTQVSLTIPNLQLPKEPR
jgi:hypothetical protein